MATLERYVCWDPERVDLVMEIEAELSRPSIFTAVHTAEPLQAHRASSPIRSPEEFRDAFLAPAGRDVRAVVIGDAGSGKSHFVHWVELNIGKRDDLRVVSVPRSGTSLRWIVEKLIEELPPDEQGTYREKLVATPESVADFAELEIRLIHALELQLHNWEPTDEIGEALAANLQVFLRDPVLEKHHVGEQGIIADLVRHMTQVSGRDERAARRRFAEVDLHLDSARREMAALSAPARSFLRVLHGDRELRERAIELVNAHLDAAVTQTLGFTGGEMTQLLNEIRRHLRRQGLELVLLVEDLVRTEGIDRALLDALIESREDLCRLRLLIAVTSGYYETGLLDTQRQRFEYVIDMNGRPPLVEDDRLAPFTARYLNALRAKPDELDSWYEARGADAATDLPNTCLGCEYQETCHAAFGARTIEGAGSVGLYPFTEDALANMAERARERSQNPEFRFGPRELLRDVLRPIVRDIRAREIKAAEFPDQPLLDAHGGRLLSVEIQAAVRAAAGANADRYLVLLELWGAAPRTLTALPDDVYRAFSLAPLTLEGAASATPSRVAESVPGAEESSPSAPDRAADALQQRLDLVESWANGGPMTSITNDLRGLVSSAVGGLIDWDGEGLERTVFAGSAGGASAFQNRSIDFARQDTREASTQIKLNLPLEDTHDSQLATARALQGLMSFERHGHWGFENGLEQFLVLSEELPKWAGIVLEQLRHLADPLGEWDPVASALEVLAIGATLASRPPRIDASLPDRLEALFGAWPDPGELQIRSDGWRELYAQIHRRVDELRGIVLAHAGAMKGGRRGSMLDAARVVEPLRVLYRTWQLAAIPPSRLADEQLPDRYQHLLQLHAALRTRLSDVVREERDARLAWLDGVREDLPEGTGRLELVSSLQQSREAVLDFGLPISNRLNSQLEEEFEAFSRVNLNDAIRLTDELRDFDGEAGELLPRMAGGRRGDAMDAADRFLPIARAFLDEAESKFISARERTTGADEIEQQFSSIGSALESIEGDLLALEGDDT
jgi:hypothetical protein